MSGLPEELIFLLVFGFVWLTQFLRRRRGRQAPRPVVLPAPAAPAPAPEAAQRAQSAPRVPAFVPNLVPNVAEGPRPAVVRRERPAPAAAPPERLARRYSRSVLMGDRRAVQDAIVVATILQPCRAKKSYGSD